MTAALLTMTNAQVVENEYTFAPIYLVEHWIAYWVAGGALLIAATLIVAGLWRERRHRAMSARENRNVDLRLVSDATLQRRIGYGFGVVAVLGLIAGVYFHVSSQQNFVANMKEKYPVTAVENVTQTGGSFTADLTFEDGTTEDKVLVLIDPGSEPVFGDDLRIESVGGS
ncbi:MAG: hypothetical protein Q4G34_10540 [Micrococcus sp.]|nr:hypothetical protein [Micrococcus sp.]